MIYFDLDNGEELEGHVDDLRLIEILLRKGSSVVRVQADGDELVHAWRLLGRAGEPPKQLMYFTGSGALDIALNW